MERPAPKPALITPSASPPLSRPFFPQPYRIPDQASPTKRPRLSTPRQFQPHVSRSSSSTSLDQVDFHQAREASTLRMLDVWSSLAERYARPLDEDDIIDLGTGEVVKDRGVIRESRNWDLGCFADDVGEDEDEDGEEDEDVDELDSFAKSEVADIQDVGAEIALRNVPPVTRMDPADAEDLREFLEAERTRRETCGSEVESSGEENHEEQVFIDDYHASVDTGDTEETQGATVREDGGHDESVPTQGSGAASVYVDSGSEDELGGWDVDEASIVYRLPKKAEEEDSDSEIEFVGQPRPCPSPSHPPNPKNKPNPTTMQRRSGPSMPVALKQLLSAQKQLQTPPQSQDSSFGPSTISSDDCCVPPPPDSSSLPPSSPPLSSPPSSSFCGSSPTKSPLHKSDSQYGHSKAPDYHPDRPIPRLDLNEILKTKFTTKSISGSKLTRSKSTRPQSPMRPQASGSRSTPSNSSNGEDQTSFRSAQTDTTEQTPKPRRSHVEVVIDRRPPFKPSKETSLEIPPPIKNEQHTTEMARKDSVSKQYTVRNSKGKEKGIYIGEALEGSPVSEDQSDDPITILSSPSVPPVKKVQSQPHHTKGDRQTPMPIISKYQAERSGHIEKPSLPKATTRKRKRVLSSPEIEHHTYVDAEDRLTNAANQSNAHIRKERLLSGREPSGSKLVKDLDIKLKPRLKSTPQQKSRASSQQRQSDRDSDSEAVSSSEHFPEPSHHYKRSQSHFNPMDLSYYTYPQPPYATHQPSHMYVPIPDPRAQFIITQAMHQLSALVGGQWTPPVAQSRSSTPFTPSHHHPASSNSMYSTPTHRPHPYPYAYDPNFPSAILQPRSPEAADRSLRNKSLVRSRSRGRRVSFMIEDDIVDVDAHSSSVERDQELDGGLDSKYSGLSNRKSASERVVISSEDEGSPDRGRSFARARTPGPSVCTQSSASHSSNSGENVPSTPGAKSSSRTGVGRRSTAKSKAKSKAKE